MDKEIAKNLMANLLALSEPMNSVAETIELIDDEAQKLPLKQAIYKIIGDVYVDLMRPIIREYPEYDPDCLVDGRWETRPSDEDGQLPK